MRTAFLVVIVVAAQFFCALSVLLCAAIAWPFVALGSRSESAVYRLELFAREKMR